MPAGMVLQDLGSAWLRAGRSLALLVPSVQIPQQQCILIKPAHPEFARLTIGPPQPFTFDGRLLPETPPGRLE